MRDRGGVLAASVLAIVVGVAGWLRHLNHWTGAFDLGIFDQAAWQLAHGRSSVSLVERSIFADHFSPVLLVFAPLYRIAATPAWLIGTQAVALGATVLPMRAMARDLGVSERLATALVCGSAPLLAAALFDFHPSTLAVPFVALAVLHLRRDAAAPAGWAAAAVVLCRADLSIVLVALSVLARGRTRWTLLAIGAAGSVAGVAVPDLLGNAAAWPAYYDHLGESPVDAALHPWRVISAVVEIKSLSVLGGWMIPSGLLLLARPRWLLAVVVAGAPVLLSQWPGTDLPWFHYGAPYAPIVIGGTLVLLTDEDLRRRARSSVLQLLPLGGSALALLLMSPLAPGAPAAFRITSLVRTQPAREPPFVADLVGRDDAVSGSLHVLVHFMHREHAHLFPLPFAPRTRSYPDGLAPEPDPERARDVDVVILEQAELEPSLLSGFEVVAEGDGYVVLRRR